MAAKALCANFSSEFTCIKKYSFNHLEFVANERSDAKILQTDNDIITVQLNAAHRNDTV